MRKLIALVILVLVLAALAISPVAAGVGSTTAGQEQTLISLTAEAGFDGYFRDGGWLPISVRLTNAGDGVSGRLVVRPETSGSGIANTYSTPITLPRGGDQTAILYITARSFATQIRVELIDDAGVVVAQTTTSARSIQPQDRLHVVVTESALGAVDLSAIKTGIFSAFQANWSVAQIPDNAAALDAVDLVLFTEVDTGALSEAQRTAIRAWVMNGGHLVVTGGANWQANSAGLIDLLPLVPDSSVVVGGLAPLAEWLNLPADDLGDDTVVSTGTLIEAANTLVFGGTPLIARRSLGSGTVDYLTMSPTDAPLRGWTNAGDLWFALATSTRPQTTWSNGVVDWDSATRASEILPGYDPLPDILPLLAFLVGYIGLIGPINYVVLTRINRREWAWVTIPLFILIFSGLAWLLGSNFRGNEATLNRLALVQVWADNPTARVDGVVGLLSPQRGAYSLSGTDVIRPIPRVNVTTGIFARGSQANIEISEGSGFTAQNFTVDASFIAGFNVTTTIDAPEIGGSAAITYDEIAGQQVVIGSVRNDSDLTLTDPVVLARGVAYRLGQPLAPGDILPFDLTLPGESLPSPVLRTSTGLITFSSRTGAFANKQTVTDIMGPENIVNQFGRIIFETSPDLLIQRRRQYFLSALIDDAYGATGRGDRVYLAGWSDQSPLALDMQGANWNAQNTTLYLVELSTALERPNEPVTIAPDQFTWVVRERVGMGEIAPINLQMQPGDDIAFQFTPLPDAVLSRVDALLVQLADVNVGGRNMPVYLWDWQVGDWEQMSVANELLTITAPERYLGAQNAVRLRIVSEEAGGYVRVGRVLVSQTGEY
ncbi:MAG: hypothetical protein IAE80_17095 [Anaerolinea sp.]|nr:hypothetical protein [Anaerolinea sp.]